MNKKKGTLALIPPNNPLRSNFHGRPISRYVRSNYVESVSFPQKHILSGKEFIKSLDLPDRLPARFIHIVETHDALDLKVHCRPLLPMITQWNGMTSGWGFDTTAIEKIERSSPLRALPEAMNLKGRGIYQLAHEAAHGIFSEIGYRGLFRKTLRQSKPWSFFVVGEMFAEYASNYELPKIMRPYWSRHWRPFTEQPVGQAVNAGSAAFRAGLREPSARAQFHLQSYFAKQEKISEVDPKKLFEHHPELMSMWLSVRAYSIQSWKVTEKWWELYWKQESLQNFILDFIPDQGAQVWLGKNRKPVEVHSLQDFVSIYDKILTNWNPGPKEQILFFRLRKKMQQAGLSIAQMFRLIEYDGLRLSRGKSERIYRILAENYEQIKSEFNRLQSMKESVIRPTQFKSADAELAGRMKKLIDQLVAIAGSPAVFFTHPGIYGADLNNGDSNLSWLNYKIDNSATQIELNLFLAKLSQVLSTLKDDHLAHLGLANDMGRASFDVIHLSALASEAELRANNYFPLSENRAFIKNVRRWYENEKSKNRLVKCFKFEWMQELPFVDPLVGYRIR